MKRLVFLALVALLAATAAGCGGDDEAATDTTAPAATGAGSGTGAETGAAGGECAKEGLELVSEGRLTIGTDNPAYPPWFGGEPPAGSNWEISDPASGEGFESAVAYEVADRLGFAQDEVEWIVVPFNNSFRPGPKDFDFDINQISYTPEREQAVDFSDSYYEVNQALVAMEGSELAGATGIADLTGAKLGVQVGTTSYEYIVENIQPDQQPNVYDTSNDVISALRAGQIEGIVVDLPTAFYVTAAELEGSTIVGQFPAVGEQERFGMVFAKDSSLDECVNEALAEMREDGTLEEIQQEWLSDKVDAPVLE